MNMKNFLKKLHITSNNQSEDGEGSCSSRGSKSSDVLTSPDKPHLHSKSSGQFTEVKPFSGLSGWLNSVTSRHSSPTRSSSSNVARIEQSNLVSNSGLDVAGTDILGRDSGCNDSRDPDVEEEYQIQLALELSAREDPEAVQIEAVKQISLGSCPPDNTPAEVVAFRYWNYHLLSYDDKIMDGFYDLYGVMNESTSEKMPSLVDLQGTPVSDGVTWEAVLVNRAADANLDKLEQKALALALKSRLGPLVSFSGDLVRKIASVVSDYMGGPVGNPENMLKSWQNLSYSLKDSIGSMVLPLGSLTIGLARHRALLFKVLADSVGIPCRLVKGHQYTGSDGVAMCFVKTEDGREYIVDLMADPGTLIPSDAAGSHIDYNESIFSTSHFSSDITFTVASSSSGLGSSYEDASEFGLQDKRPKQRNVATAVNKSDERGQLIINNNVIRENKVEDVNILSDSSSNPGNVNNDMFWDLPSRPNFPFTHGRSPSWTEGVSSPAVRRMKVKDVSQYMIDAAKENPQLAQKLHDVLLESGVVAPANLFAEVLPEEFDVVRARVQSQFEVKVEKKYKEKPPKIKGQEDNHGPVRFLPPLPNHGIHSKPKPKVEPEHSKFVDDLEINHRLNLNEVSAQPIPSHAGLNEARYVKKVPVAAAAATAAAVVASSMVVAAAKSSTESTVDLPVAAAATATAAAVVATTACLYQSDIMQSDDDHHDVLGTNTESDRVSDISTGNESVKSDAALDDVSDCEIPWDEIAVGERIGLGSYGEVYRGDWHGTEVAVKRFLEQDISGESLEEFRSEIRIMKRLRHPNVVLFMGAVTRAPNLSIITEFLPRGSLYRLIHRPNNHLDARRRLKMAFDAARGMNYLHSSTPVIVHRDLKSPNLLVDKNWVVKVCDFGLSRMKHSTYLSSRSTAGTAEWMAPEVLRNEPSDEKCDVYSYGVILWELSTMQQPWGGMNPMQVVGAVGFQHRRLDIPDDMDPAVADIIKQCWQTDPKLRPTFTEIMAALKPLQKPITSQFSRSSAKNSAAED